MDESNDISHIIDNIYLGNLRGSLNSKLLNDKNIKAIVRILNPDNITINKVKDLLTDNINYHYISLYDIPSECIYKYYNDFFQFMSDNKDKNILIHCAMGISRSATFVILYLLKNYKMEFDESIQFVKSKRSIINPNGGFLLQLKKYYDSLNEDIVKS